MNSYFLRLTRAGKFRYTLASIVTFPIRLILVGFAYLGRFAEYLNEGIDNYGKLFITWGRTKAQKNWENS